MTDLDSHPLTDPQREELINSLKNEITSLKFRLEKKEEKVVTLENMLNTTMKCLNARNDGWGDLRDKLEDVIEMLKKRVSYGDILDFLKVKDDEMRSYPI